MPTFPWPSNITNINQTIWYANTVSEGYLGYAFLLIIFMVIFMSLKVRYPSEMCLLSASFTTTIASVMLYLFGLLPPAAPPILAIITAFSVAYTAVRGGGT